MDIEVTKTTTSAEGIQIQGCLLMKNLFYTLPLGDYIEIAHQFRSLLGNKFDPENIVFFQFKYEWPCARDVTTDVYTETTKAEGDGYGTA